MKLLDIAHSRTGDKGNISNISLIVYNEKDYELIREKVTAEKVKEYFKDIVHGEVVRYEIPNLGALNFVMDEALGGGVTRSLALDKHGKSLSSALLEMEI
ncbi:AtuA-related protein [Fusobacterium sp. THCT1E2]